MAHCRPDHIEFIRAQDRADAIGRHYAAHGWRFADAQAVGVHLIRLRGDLVIPDRVVKICRDPKDDKFLTAALAGQADYIVSGDADLLVLSPFEKIPILSPTAFLAELPSL